MTLKPYRLIPIEECGEPLLPIPAKDFVLISPHPYEKLGAPYGQRSPFYLRQSVLQRLYLAQTLLQTDCPGWRIQIFDAYRPLAVQQFMVHHAFAEVVAQHGWEMGQLSADQRQEALQMVYEFWAAPEEDITKPPPHSTGGAVDLTVVNAIGEVIEMGSPIDEISVRSYPGHFANSPDPVKQQFHCHREWLRQAMIQAGFQQHPNEWWHFSYGDQMWAWLMAQEDPGFRAIARYGRRL
jgi:D-alanyl-D-alanine dipeptidase